MYPLYEYKDIKFRKLDKTDITNLLSLKNESWRSTHTVTLANFISQERWIESISLETHCPRNLVLVASCENDDCNTVNIGILKFLNIDWQNRKAEVGWDVYKPYRGKGFGKKIVAASVKFAKEVLNLRRLEAEILVTNVASLHCALEAGFIKEGLQKEAIFKLGNYVDNILLGVLL